MLVYAATLIVAFILSLGLGLFSIPLLRRLKIGQSIRAVGPKSHLNKAGTPTMGGIIFVASALAVSLIFAPREPAAYLVVLMMLSFGGIGFADDYIKVVLKRPLGLKARHKLAAQSALAVMFYLLLRGLDFGSGLEIPWLGSIELGWFYPFLVLLVLVGTANAVNLADGLDGLAGGLGVVTLLGYALVGRLGGFDGVVHPALALAGGIMGFLVFNLHPAKVFMGDTGSLAIGGAIAALAVLTRTEILLLSGLGIVFVIEAVSVIIQVLFFRMKRRRVFLMAPIHHHYELKGWSEWKVCLAFWLVQIAGTLAALVVWRLSQ